MHIYFFDKVPGKTQTNVWQGSFRTSYRRQAQMIGMATNALNS